MDILPDLEYSESTYRQRWNVIQMGSGPDAIMLHGSPGSVEDLLPLAYVLKPHLRLTQFDRAGHGRSQIRAGLPTLATNVVDVRRESSLQLVGI